MSINDILQQTEKKMESSIEALRRELISIRTGRASAGLVEHIRVDYGGTMLPLNQMGNITVPEARLIVIQPWDRGAIGLIEKAIQKSEIGINPASDGTVIRLAIPPLSQERRVELTKMVHKRVEDDKIAIRNLRRDSLENIKKLEKDKEISQDESKRAQERLQKVTDSFTATADKLRKDKETELLTS